MKQPICFKCDKIMEVDPGIYDSLPNTSNLAIGNCGHLCVSIDDGGDAVFSFGWMSQFDRLSGYQFRGYICDNCFAKMLADGKIDVFTIEDRPSTQVAADPEKIKQFLE